MARTYRYRLHGDPKSMIVRMRSEVASFPAVRFTGDEKSGSVEGMGLKASYSVAGDVIDLTIHRIPIIVSWGKVEEELERRAPSWGATRIG